MSKFSEYKEATNTTPTTAYLHTELYSIIKKLASAKSTTITAIMAECLTAYVNANGYPEYEYPTKESQSAKIARLEAEIAALKAQK